MLHCAGLPIEKQTRYPAFQDTQICSFSYCWSGKLGSEVGGKHSLTIKRRCAISLHYSVWRAMVHVPSGCELRAATVTPAGGNRSVGAGNELDDASGLDSRH